MIKNQVDPIPFVVDAEPLLAADKGKVGAQLQQERFHVLDQSVLKV